MQKLITTCGKLAPFYFCSKASGTMGLAAERLILPRLREAAGITWRSSPDAVATDSRVIRCAQPNRTLRRARRLLCRAGNKSNPHGVTHSLAVQRSGQTPGAVLLPSALLQTSHRGKGQGAANREKWQRGGEFGSSQGAMHRKGTEYARCKAFPWLGTEETVNPIPPLAEKGEPSPETVPAGTLSPAPLNTPF